MKFFDKSTGLFIAEPEANPFEKGIANHTSVLNSSKSLILSASGWRKIFAEDGNEESTITTISSADKIIAGVMAVAFSRFIREKTGLNKPLITVGMDSRPTGPAIGDIMNRVFISEGIQLQSLFIVAAPGIMAYSSTSPDINGFAYISASHNPVGHNGLKFGMDGGVIGGTDSKKLITTFKELLYTPGIVKIIVDRVSETDTQMYRDILNNVSTGKQNAYNAYFSFSRRIISGSENKEIQNNFFKALKENALKKPVGVIGELNGSARSLSIDREILSCAGIKVLSFNDTPGKIVHRIVPEGYSLDDCRILLEEHHDKDNAFLLGYVPDNDGDRGNIVYFDNNDQKAKILEAQEVFALAILGELAFLSASPTISPEHRKLAVAINGPTSMRIDRIAHAFGARVFRAEVGEANVVSLAEQLREKGYTVRILGEGSNGGNITHPAKVRDPINTVFSLLKLLLYKDRVTGNDLFKIWCVKSKKENNYRNDYSLTDIIKTLPLFTTTNAFESTAVMKIKTTSHRLLKSRYETLFQKEWKEKRDYLNSKFNITDWKEINYEGTTAREGVGNEYRSGEEKGGLKIIFMNSTGRETDYIWMRGSGTEPVFRVLADCEGNDKEREAWFLNWHRSIIEKADKGDDK